MAEEAQSQEPQQSQPQSQDITVPQTGPGGRAIVAAHEPTHPSHRETSLLSGGIGTPFLTPYNMETQQDTRVNVGDSSNIYDAGYDNWLMGPTLTHDRGDRGGRTPRPRSRSIRRDMYMKLMWCLTALANLVVVIGFKKEGYILFGRVTLTDDQITKLANTADSTCLIIMVLLAIHFWLVIKESNPIFATESISRKVEIYLAIPIIYITFMRIWLYKPDPLPTVQPEADTALATATGGRRLGERDESYEAYYRMERNNYCDKCFYGCCMLCDRCCSSTYNICCGCYEWDYVQCECGICDCN
ncbi:16995_t:CDS:2, partial [Racocetra persica]